MCYHPGMTVNLHVRDVPDHVHATLVQRAERSGMSLRQYAIEVLAEHCALPSLDEWLDEVRELRPAGVRTSGAQAVEEAREADDLEVAGARDRP